MKRKYKIWIDKENIDVLKNELKADESLETTIRTPKSERDKQKPVITVSVKLISTNKADLVLQTIKSNNGEVVGEPTSVGKFEEKNSKLTILKTHGLSLIITWIALTATGFMYNLDNPTMIKSISIPLLSILISFGVIFRKKLRIPSLDTD